MKAGICDQPLIPMRSEPKDGSELVTMLLFGEMYEIVDQHGDWYFVQHGFDGYQGWFFSREPVLLTEKEAANIEEGSMFLAAEPFLKLVSENRALVVGLGSPLPNFNGHYCRINDEFFLVKGRAKPTDNKGRPSYLEELALSLLEAPYLWGGRTTHGLDCSGFTQILYRFAEVDLPRDAKEQAKLGDYVNSFKEKVKGDIAYFKNQDGKIGHTGIVLDSDKVIHASEKVRIDLLTDRGIYRETLGEYTHQLHSIKSILNNTEQ